MSWEQLARGLVECWRCQKIDSSDKEGFTPLLRAAELGDLALVKKLIGLGAAPTKKTGNGETMTHLVAKLDVDGSWLELMEYLKKNGWLDLGGDKYNLTPLYRAVQANNFKLTEWLLREGAAVNTADDYFKESPLYEAGKNMNRPIVELLIKYGGTIDHNADWLIKKMVDKALENNDYNYCEKDILVTIKKIMNRIEGQPAVEALERLAEMMPHGPDQDSYLRERIEKMMEFLVRESDLLAKTKSSNQALAILGKNYCGSMKKTVTFLLANHPSISLKNSGFRLHPIKKGYYLDDGWLVKNDDGIWLDIVIWNKDVSEAVRQNLYSQITKAEMPEESSLKQGSNKGE